tara:strand:+ start:516 stop:1082 length:567 start_codon:yes stop_codon:yes gene_type:complete
MNQEIYKSYDTEVIQLRNITEYYDNQLRIELVKYKPIVDALNSLPGDIQKKIFFYALRKHHKSKILYIPLVPSWMKYKNYVTSELKKAVLDNVHFLHLDFNTLPENKEWIPGCQCDFCRNYENKEEGYIKLLNDDNYFNDCIHCYDDNYWNRYSQIFDYDDCIVFDVVKDYCKDNKTDFSEKIKKKYL